MTELYLEHGNLVEEQEWHKRLDELRASIQETSQTNLEPLRKALVSAVQKRIPNAPVGVFFSGGVDSAFIALLLKQLGCKLTLYCVGFKTEEGAEPRDILAAEEVANYLDLPLIKKVFDVTETEQIIKETVRLLGEHANVVTVGVGGVVVAARQLGKNSTHFFGGLGSEELFAGYDRHKKNPSLEECWEGLHSMYQRDLLRDVTLGKKLKFQLHTPFLDADVIIQAMSMPLSTKLSDIENKIAIRKIAEQMGLGKHAWRKKIAAQYGSSLDRVMAKLAKRNRFSSKKAYLHSLQE